MNKGGGGGKKKPHIYPPPNFETQEKLQGGVF